MIIKTIELHNFKCFEGTHKFSFNNTTFIRGSNGIGKSSLTKDALLFAFYGYTSQKSLSNLITKGQSSCSVKIEFDHQGVSYTIIRKYPTSIEIIKDKELCVFTNSREAQNYLNDLLHDSTYFKKFRMIDKEEGIDFLQEGKTALKKTLFSMYEGFINDVRKNLLNKKREREIYNKDNLNIASCYPSIKRLAILKESIDIIEKTELFEIEEEIAGLEEEIRQNTYKKGKLESKKKTLVNQKNKLLEGQICYVCNQPIQKDNHEKLLKEKNEEIVTINNKLKNIPEVLEELKEISTQKKNSISHIRQRVSNLQSLVHKLETRIKQKEYKYTSKDVLILKKAIEKIDEFSSYYLVESIKVLEPIINSILSKIGFEIKFNIVKNSINMSLYKGDIEYQKEDLSTGQRLLLQIAFKLALLMEKNEEGLIIADEGLGSLDKENLLNVIEIIRNLPFQLLFVLHRFDDLPEDIKIIDLNKEEV